MSATIEINQVGKREDLRDFISLADVRERPLLAMATKMEGPGNMRIDWQVDKFDTADADNSVADGVDVSTFDDKAEHRALLSNYCQKFRRSWRVGDLAENISNIAGLKGGEAARAVDKCLEEIARDIEKCIGSNNKAQLETGSSTPYKTRGLGAWLERSDSGVRADVTPDAVLPIPAAFEVPAASVNTTDPVLESGLKAVLASVYAQWGKSASLDMVCGPSVRNDISGFTQTQFGSDATTAVASAASVRAFNADLNGKKIVSSITMYEGDFNSVRLHTSLLLPDNDYAYVIPFDFFGVAWGRQPRVKQLEDQGGGPRGYVDAIIGLVIKNPTVFGVFEG